MGAAILTDNGFSLCYDWSLQNPYFHYRPIFIVLFGTADMISLGYLILHSVYCVCVWSGVSKSPHSTPVCVSHFVNWLATTGNALLFMVRLFRTALRYPNSPSHCPFANMHALPCFGSVDTYLPCQ